MAVPAVQGLPQPTHNGSSTSYTGTIPTGVQIGEFLLAHITARVLNASISVVPSGWTVIDSNASGAATNFLYWKIATASETAGSTVTWTGTSAANSVIITRVSGTDTTTPIHTKNKSIDGSTTTSVVMPTVTTTVNDCLLFYCPSASANVTGTIPTPPIEQYDGGTGSGATLRWTYGATEDFASPGTSTARTITASGGVASAKQTIAIAAPAVVAATGGVETPQFQPIAFY